MALLEIPTQTFRERSTPVLETGRLILRAPRLGDVKAITAQANDRRIAENTSSLPHPYRLADAQDFVARASNSANETIFVVTLRSGGVIGTCGLMTPADDNTEVGYWLGVKHWGKGYATEAARAVIDHAFTDLDCEALQSTARVTNPASRRVLEKCGFQWTGAGLRRVRALNSSVPVDRFQLDRGLWASLKSWGQSTRIV